MEGTWMVICSQIKFDTQARGKRFWPFPMQSRLSASPTTHTQPHCTRSRLTTCSQTSCSPLSRLVCAGHNSLTCLQAAFECDSRCQLCLACAGRGKTGLPPTQLIQLVNNILLSLPYIISHILQYDYIKYGMIY